MPSFNTTAKHALRWLTGSSLVSDIDAGFQALAEDLDAKIAVDDQGALASRPVSTPGSPGKAGRYYYVNSGASAGTLWRDYGTGWTEITLKPSVVTALPASPYDGQEVYFLADASTGVMWHMRYRAASPASFKWEFLGGSEFHFSHDTGSNNVADNTWREVYGAAFSGLLQAPLAGVYRCRLYASVYKPTDVGSVFLGAGVVAPATVLDYTVIDVPVNVRRPLSVEQDLQLNAGDWPRPWSKADGGGQHVVDRVHMFVRPIKLG